MPNKSMANFYKALEEGADLLDRLNETYPDLADDFTQNSVEEFRRKSVSLHNHQNQAAEISTSKQLFTEETASTNPAEQKRIETAQELLAIHSLDDVLDILQTEHGTTLDLPQLASLVGNSAYTDALRREAREFQSNAISLPQIAQLWKDFGRPPIGDTEWTVSSVSMILE